MRMDVPPRGSTGDLPALPLPYEEFVEGVQASLLRLALARTGDPADAEDLVQDVLLDAHRRWDTLSRYDDPRAWARRAVLNRAVSRWRRHRRERVANGILGSRPQPASGTEIVLSDDALWAAIRSLAPRQRDVVLLLWFEDLPVAETASVLGCGPETVRTHWRRARASLAARLGEHDDLEDR
jgi:RNA polymerase sigma-70 factor (sigma-E family)